MAKRERLKCSSLLIEHAKQLYPVGGAADGRPSWEAFSDGPLAAATAYFQRQFDEAPEAAPGIKAWVTVSLPLFPPLAFYAARVADYIELLDFSVEEGEGFWE